MNEQDSAMHPEHLNWPGRGLLSEAQDLGFESQSATYYL